jgi:hypothetical protein
MVCREPRTDEEIVADAQAHLDRLEAAMQRGEVARGPRGPRLLGPFQIPAGTLDQVISESARGVWLLRDEGRDVFMVLECFCNPAILGVRTHGPVDYVILQYRRDTPGVQYLSGPGSEDIRRMTGDDTVPIRRN